MRILKAKKMSYSRQYENGMMSKEGIRILSQAVELAMDSDDVEIKVKDLHYRFIHENCCKRFVRKRAEALAEKRKNCKIKPPRTYWRRICYHMVVTNRTYAKFMIGVVFLHSLIIGVDIYFHPSIIHIVAPQKHTLTVDYLLITAKFFILPLYFIECIIKILAYSYPTIWKHGVRRYLKSFWNITDLIVLVGCLEDLRCHTFDVATGKHKLDGVDENSLFTDILDTLVVLRILRLLRVLEIFYPDIVGCMDKLLDTKMAFTYELGRCYAFGESEILDMLPYMIDNKKIRDEMKHKIEGDRILITKLLGQVQRDKPWIAITVKTTQAIRTILNSMNDSINQIKSAGWVDTYDYEKLIDAMDDLYKKVNSIKKVQPSAPKVIFKEVAWMAEEEAVIDFLFENVTVKRFEPGEVVFEEGNVADGIYIVVTGLFMITYTPDENILASLREYGRLPIVDYMSGTKYQEPAVDFIVSGNCIGELSTLTERPYNSVITADSFSQVYVISRGVLRRAMELSLDPVLGLECRIWKDVSVRIAIPLLLSVPAYQTFSQDQVKCALERSFVPNLTRYKIFAVTDMIEDIILIEGVIADFNTREMFVAPCVIPRTVQKLILPTSSLMNIPIDIETKLLIIPAKDVDEYDVMMVAEETCELVATGSSLKCLQHTVQDRIKNRRKANTRGMAVSISHGSRGHRSNLGSQGTSMGSNPSKYTVSEASSNLFFKTVQSEATSIYIAPEAGKERSIVNILQRKPSQPSSSKIGPARRQK